MSVMTDLVQIAEHYGHELQSWLGANKPRWTLLMCLMGIAGCGGNEGEVPVHRVSGRIQVEGESPVGALLVFHPTRQPPRPDVPTPVARVKQDGSFAVTTYQEGDGAPAGEYAVTIDWRPLVQHDGETKAGPNVLAPEYSKPTSTPLKVTVEAASRELDPIELPRAVAGKPRTAAKAAKAAARIVGED